MPFVGAMFGWVTDLLEWLVRVLAQLLNRRLTQGPDFGRALILGIRGGCCR
jgi:hypothetical protein